MAKIHVIYHDPCYDGFASAWLMHLWFKSNPINLCKEIKFYPGKYGMPFPVEANSKDEVYIVDFSFPREVCVEMYPKFKKFVILDHHKSAIDKLRDLDYLGVFDTTHSGVGLTYKYIMGQLGGFGYLEQEKVDSVYTIVSYVEDRDLYLFNFDETKNFYHYLSVVDKKFLNWDIMLSLIAIGDIHRMLMIGCNIRIAESMYIENILSRSKKIFKIEDPLLGVTYSIPAFNVSKEYGSDLCNTYMKNTLENFCIYYHIESDKVVFGIRSVGDSDCIKIAQIFEGGGHLNASAWTGDLNMLVKFLEE